ncbi:MAG: tetratricopeptide repeat protein [Cyanobacteria bacterium]|nr:tetratricopeptide repeat protein [Cyanobacteriota bacterium]
MTTSNRLLGGRYQFIQVLGSGERRQTLLVADVHYPGHPRCVIKQLKLPTRNPTTLKFILSLLKKKLEVLEMVGRHQQIPNTLASFQDQKHFYLVQEFIPGQSLADELIVGQPWPQQKVLLLLREVLRVLVFVQEHGVIHSNLKPSNIIRRHGDDQILVSDFGLLKEINWNVSSKETLPENEAGGLPWAYVPLEQRQGSTRFCTDHYALGMIAVQALTGLPPSDLPDAAQPDLQTTVIRLLQQMGNVGINIASLIARMVHPEPDRRYQKAAAILSDLNRLVEEPEPTPADRGEVMAYETPQPSVTAPTKPKPFQGKKGWIGAVALAVVALGIGAMALRLPQRLLASQRLGVAEAAAQNGDPEAAIAHYSEALEIDPSNGEALAARGQLYSQINNPEAGLADLTAAIDTKPDHPTWVYQRGNLRFGVGDVQGAIDDYTTALKLDPTSVSAHVNRGTARAEWGDDLGAVEDYTAALDLDPPLALRAAAYLNRCLSYSNLGQQVRALVDCTEAINLRPSHGLAYQNRGLVRRRLEEFQGAIQDYNIAIQIEPNSSDPYYNRGLARQDLKDFTGALADFSKAIALDDTHVFALYDRGLLHAQLNQIAKARADFEAASQLCLELGRVGCYEDAQYQISLLPAD